MRYIILDSALSFTTKAKFQALGLEILLNPKFLKLRKQIMEFVD